MRLLPVYLRHEPTRDAAAMALEKVAPGATKGMTDVVVYRDADCKEVFCRFAPDASQRPRRGQKQITLKSPGAIVFGVTK